MERVKCRGCVNKTLFKSVHREDVWLRALKQDSEEDRRVVLMNEWAEKKWKMMRSVDGNVEEGEVEEIEEEKEEKVEEKSEERTSEDKTNEKTSEKTSESAKDEKDTEITNNDTPNAQ